METRNWNVGCRKETEKKYCSRSLTLCLFKTFISESQRVYNKFTLIMMYENNVIEIKRYHYTLAFYG